MGAQWKAKHKDIAANAKGKLFGKLVKDIIIAARNGPDPTANARLRDMARMKFTHPVKAEKTDLVETTG